MPKTTFYFSNAMMPDVLQTFTIPAGYYRPIKQANGDMIMRFVAAELKTPLLSNATVKLRKIKLVKAVYLPYGVVVDSKILEPVPWYRRLLDVFGL